MIEGEPVRWQSRARQISNDRPLLPPYFYGFPAYRGTREKVE